MATSPIIDYSQTVAVPVAVVVPTPVAVDRFDIGTRALLQAAPTALIPVGSIYRIVTGAGSSRVLANLELQAGPANPADPSQLIPNDYDAVNNNKHWQVVSGLLP